MLKPAEAIDSRWCIVVANDHGPDHAVGLRDSGAPIQYCRLGGAATPLQRALHRATAIVPRSQVLVTAFENYRELWEPSFWFVRPERRFLCNSRTASPMSLAAAILSVAEDSLSNIIVILPGCCHVEHEGILRNAIHHALAALPNISEGAVTLGMLDIEESADEDYLVVTDDRTGPGLRIDGVARRPVPWVARRIRQQGAFVASGIIVGYAGALVSHLSKQLPGIVQRLTECLATARAAEMECYLPPTLMQGVSSTALRSLRWQPPAFSQRAFIVRRCGWAGLRSPRAVAHMIDFMSCLDDSSEFDASCSTSIKANVC